MPTEEGLKLILTADAGSLISGVENTKKSIAGTGPVVDLLKSKLFEFQKALKLATDPKDVKSLTDGINQLKRDIGSINKATNPFKGVELGATQAGTSVHYLDGVLSSFDGTAKGTENAISSFVESFARLREQTGSTAGAFEAFGSSLLGSGGIAAGIAIALPLLIELGKKFFGAGEDAENSKEKIQEFAKSLEYLGSETSRIGSLISGENKVRISELKAQGATEQQIYEATNKALKERRELLGGHVNKLDLESAAIQDDPKFDAAKFDELIESGKELTGIYARFDVVRKESLKAEKEYYDNEQEITITANENLQRIREDKERAQKQADDKATAANKKRLADLERQYEKELKIIQQRELEIKQFLAAPIQDGKQNDEFRDMMQRSIIDINPSDKLTQIIPLKFQFDFSGLKNNLKIVSEEAQAEIDKINAIITQGFQNGFEGLGEGLAEAFSGAGIEAVFTNIFSVMGDLIQQMGKALIQYGIVKTGLDKVVKAGFGLPGVTAIAIGVGAVAIGALVKKSIQHKAFAEGGLVYGPTKAIFGEYPGASSNPEVVAPLDKLKDIIGNNSGSMGVNISGLLRIDGNDLVLAYARNIRRQGRNG